MAPSDFQAIARFANAVEAEQIRGILEENGVSAFVDGADLNTVLSVFGSALGGVRILVRASDVNRATEIMDSFGSGSSDSGEAWFCGKCKEEVDGGFHVCWSCGNERMKVEQPIPDPVIDEAAELGREQHAMGPVETFDHSSYDPSNPYASPLTSSDLAPPDKQHFEVNHKAEAMLLRAWRASIIGLVIFPIVLNIYSMFLLIRAALLSANFSPEGQKLFHRAFAVNVIAGCGWGVLLNTIYF